MKTALITGISGQGGAHLAKHLVEEGFRVIGTSRNAHHADTQGLERLGILNLIIIKSLDLLDAEATRSFVDQHRPSYIYHLAAPSSVAMSFREPAETIVGIVTSTTNLLEAIRKSDTRIPCFIANSTEIFGDCLEPASAQTSHNPQSPYGVAKSCTHRLAQNYRNAFDMFVCSGILSNFESPLRSKNFVTAKIVSQACQIARGELKTIELGNLEVRRDWGCASEFMYAVMLCLKQQTPSDYLIATGNTSSLGDFLEFTFAALNLDYRDYLVSQERLFRPLDIKQTLCDVSQTSDYLGWSAKKSLQDVVNGMVKAEMNLHRPRLTPVQQLAN